MTSPAVEATGPGGAAVTRARTADDTVDGPVTVNCSVGDTAMDSGDTFALGTARWTAPQPMPRATRL